LSFLAETPHGIIPSVLGKPDVIKSVNRDGEPSPEVRPLRTLEYQAEQVDLTLDVNVRQQVRHGRSLLPVLGAVPLLAQPRGAPGTLRAARAPRPSCPGRAGPGSPRSRGLPALGFPRCSP